MTKHSKPRVRPQLKFFHFTFAPKYRRALLADAHSKKLADYLIRYICAKKGIKVKALAVMDDHVHLFANIPHRLNQDEVMQAVKWFSSIHIRRLRPDLKERSPKAFWAVHYHYRTVGGDARAVDQYVKSQMKNFS